jgi:Raf kinase inhibitor-like YbhB/YbcL family protein
VSPALEWTDPPAGTKSFALMVHDPDAPTGGSGFWHWVVYNIPADTKSLPAGAGKADGSALPKGAVQGNTDIGKPGYVGPCPPEGSPTHHYNFTLYALKVDKLDIPAGSTAAFVGFNVNANALGKAKLSGTYTHTRRSNHDLSLDVNANVNDQRAVGIKVVVAEIGRYKLPLVASSAWRARLRHA